MGSLTGIGYAFVPFSKKDQTPSLVFDSFKFPLSFHFKTKRCVLVNLINVYCLRNEDVILLSSLAFISGSL